MTEVISTGLTSKELERHYQVAREKYGNTSPVEGQSYDWPDPTSDEIKSELFDRIWNVIKTWDINVPEVYNGYCGATGNHVVAIMKAIQQEN